MARRPFETRPHGLVALLDDPALNSPRERANTGGSIHSHTDIDDDDMSQPWFVGYRSQHEIMQAISRAKDGEYFITATDPQMTKLEFGYKTAEGCILETIVSKKGGQYAILGKRYANLQQLVAGLKKKQLRGKGKKVTLTNPMAFSQKAAPKPKPQSSTPRARAHSSYENTKPNDAYEEMSHIGVQRAPSNKTPKRYSVGSKAPEPDESFGGFEEAEPAKKNDSEFGFGALDGESGFEDVSPGKREPSDEFGFGDDDDDGDDNRAPNWYAGKLARDICERVVARAETGNFLVRKSSRNDKIVVCINDHGSTMNLLINVTPAGQFEFAGNDLKSLFDVVYLLRQRPLQGKSGMIRVNLPAPGLDKAKEEQKRRQGFGVEDSQFNGPLQQSAANLLNNMMPGVIKTSVVSMGSSLYDEVTLGPPRKSNQFAEDESLYMPPSGLGPPSRELEELTGMGFDDDNVSIELLDANVPSYDWIARHEEEYRATLEGFGRMSNAEFNRARREARSRAKTAAEQNLEKLAKRAAKTSGWQKILMANKEKEKEDENVFEYRNASMREFDEDDIYGQVPPWFAGRLDRDKCDKAVQNGQEGDYLVRESRQGDKFVLCVKVNGKPKNFQIIMKGANYVFSGRKHESLDKVVEYTLRKGILKDSKIIKLGNAITSF
eukprot:m.55053 g.55053  ORF g.55053 m.55053 type:complete len:663 (+) comp10963_c0_seq1:222-2210(+)